MIEIKSSDIIEICNAYADAGMNFTIAAKNLYMSTNTLIRRIRLIAAMTGLNPQDFWELYALCNSTEAELEKLIKMKIKD